LKTVRDEDHPVDGPTLAPLVWKSVRGVQYGVCEREVREESDFRKPPTRADGRARAHVQVDRRTTIARTALIRKSVSENFGGAACHTWKCTLAGISVKEASMDPYSDEQGQVRLME
jgi:hypothetical protein